MMRFTKSKAAALCPQDHARCEHYRSEWRRNVTFIKETFIKMLGYIKSPITQADFCRLHIVKQLFLKYHFFIDEKTNAFNNKYIGHSGIEPQTRSSTGWSRSFAWRGCQSGTVWQSWPPTAGSPPVLLVGQHYMMWPSQKADSTILEKIKCWGLLVNLPTSLQWRIIKSISRYWMFCSLVV